MQLLRKTAAIGVLASLLLLTTACPQKGDVLPWAREVVAGLKDAQNIFTANGYNLSKLNTAIDLGNQLITELEKPDDPATQENKVRLVANLIGRFEELVSESNRINDPKIRTIVLVTLAISNAALRRIADKLDDVPVSVMRTASPQIANIRRFKERPLWRCRSSQSGRFAAMKFCEQHPDVSQVETYYR